MQPQKNMYISIIGAGLSGSFLAVLLAKRGYKVTIFEKMSRQDTLKTSKRSINISFHDYTEKAFKTAGIWEDVKSGIISLDGSVTRLPHYKPILASFRDLKIAYYSARREKLLAALIAKAEKYPNVTYKFNTELVTIHRSERTFIVQSLRSKQFRTVTTDMIIGADGVHSLTRAFIQQGQHTLHDQNQTGWEYKQISFSPEYVKKMQLDEKRAYSSTRTDAIFVALPNKDHTFSGMLALPREKGFSRLSSDKQITDYIKTVFPELAPGLPEILPALKKNPNGSFITMTTYPWVYKDFMALVGDSAHSVTPFIGHGVTVGLGDCLVLVSLIDRYPHDMNKALANYQTIRKENADTLVAMSLESFGNFRRIRKANYGIIYARLESVLHKLMPKLFASSTFERIVFDPERAADYMRTHRKQRRKLRMVGVPLLVHIVTYGILAVEITDQYLKELMKRLSFPKSSQFAKSPSSRMSASE